MGNRIVELTIEGVEPVDCEVVIPVNIIPRAPEEAVAQALEQDRASYRASIAMAAGHQALGASIDLGLFTRDN